MAKLMTGSSLNDKQQHLNCTLSGLDGSSSKPSLLLTGSSVTTLVVVRFTTGKFSAFLVSLFVIDSNPYLLLDLLSFSGTVKNLAS